MAPLLLLLLALGAGPGERGPAGGSGAVAAAGARGPSGGGTGPGVVARDLVAGGGGRVQGRAGPCGKHRDPATPTGATATPRHQHGPTATEPTATEPTATGQLSTAESFALATLAALVLALSPLVAVALLRCPLCPRVRGWLCPAGLGLAAGALSGDGILHLLPQAMGLHSHDEGLRSRGGGPPVPRGGAAAGPPWPLLGVLGGLFGAFLLEKLLGILLPRGGEGKVDDLDRSTQELQSSGPAPLPWVVTAGRAAHGLADGLALGGAFSASWRSGAVTAAALLCHELPHALGAMGVLSRAGLSVRRMVALGLGGGPPPPPGGLRGIGPGGGPHRPSVGGGCGHRPPPAPRALRYGPGHAGRAGAAPMGAAGAAERGAAGGVGAAAAAGGLRGACPGVRHAHCHAPRDRPSPRPRRHPAPCPGTTRHQRSILH